MSTTIPPNLDRMYNCLIGEQRHEIFQQIGRKLPHHFRFNPLKGPINKQQELFREQGFDFRPAVEGRNDMFELTAAPYPVGKSLSHFLGHIYIQDLASMLPPLALEPQPGDWVLDMSAAPGSKTTQMAGMMQNEGVILANDIVGKRLKVLSYNLQRWGAVNTIMYKWYGEQFGNTYFETFDRILVDPGCSGLGTLHKNPEILTWWTPGHGERLAISQRNQLASAIKALRPGGVLTYSTCTVNPVENEGVVDYALRNFPVEVEAITIDGLHTWPGITEYEGTQYHPDVAKTIRCYPLQIMTEGFYVARLRKTAEMALPDARRKQTTREIPFHSHNSSEVKRSIKYMCEHFGFPKAVFKQYVYLTGKQIHFAGRDVQEFTFHGEPVQVGSKMAYRMDHGMKLSTEGIHLLGEHAERNCLDLPDLAAMERFVNREPLNIPTASRGQTILRYKGSLIGYAVAEGGQLKSQFPKGDWQFTLKPAGADENG